MSIKFVLLFTVISILVLFLMWLVLIPLKFKEIAPFLDLICKTPEEIILQLNGSTIQLPDLTEIPYIKIAYYFSLAWLFIIIVMIGCCFNQPHAKPQKREAEFYYEIKRMLDIILLYCQKNDKDKKVVNQVEELSFIFDYINDFGCYGSVVCKIEDRIFDEICKCYQMVLKEEKLNKLALVLGGIRYDLKERSERMKK